MKKTVVQNLFFLLLFCWAVETGFHWQNCRMQILETEEWYAFDNKQSDKENCPDKNFYLSQLYIFIRIPVWYTESCFIEMPLSSFTSLPEIPPEKG